jgi:TATA-box binding protein (TBP) (component of TFIID and TFIIIB)
MINRQIVFAASALIVSSVYASSAAQWNVQIEPVQTGEIIVDPEFKAAIYENLLRELTKTKQFGSVFRSGDRNATAVNNLLSLKTTVEAYTPGSETRRAVTTVSGATKLKVRSQLFTADGQMVLERVVDGNVRFFGSNLRATHNLAHNIAEALRHAALPEAPALSAQP